MRSKSWAIAALLAFAVGVGAQTADPLADRQYGSWGVDLAARDLAIRPGDDFDYYAGGTWAKGAVIPADSSFAGPYQDLRRLSEARLKAIIEQSPPTAPAGALYRSFMDERRIEARGIAPLLATLAPIAAATDRDALWLALARPGFAKPPITLETGPDLLDASKMSFGPWQGGLSLPDRDYYLLERFAPQRPPGAPTSNARWHAPGIRGRPPMRTPLPPSRPRSRRPATIARMRRTPRRA